MSVSSTSFALDRFTTFGDLLKYLRRRAGYTQRELSIAVGYSDTQISRLEHNERLPDLATLTARFLPVLNLEKEPEVAARLLELATAVRREDAPATGLPPYKGLCYFDESDADLFFGRETLTERLAARLTEQANAEQRFLAVVGASGSGKSSLVRAGVIPTLRWQPISSGWPLFVMTPTAHPLENLAATLHGETPFGLPSRKCADELAQQPDKLSRALQTVAETAVSTHTLLVVDQFEELFTLCRSAAEQLAFVQNLTTAACQNGGTAVILLVLRADFYAHCARFDHLRQLLARHQEYIGPMTTDELRCAIEEPAKQGHWEFEAGLVDLLLHDVGADAGHIPEPGALPLLSHALLATWQRRRGRTLTLSGYTASGGVRGAIAETAESVFYDQLDRDQRQIARQIFLRLTELGGGDAQADTRRRVTLAELSAKPEDKETVHQVLSTLADARLVTTDQDTAEVAHEALIREWPTLRGWLEEDREGLRLHRHLTEAAQEWDARNRDPDGLYRGARLAQTLEWSAQHAENVNALERTFLDASQSLAEKEQREREAQQQRELEAARQLAVAERIRAEEQTVANRRLRQRATLLVVALFIGLILGVTAVVFAQRAIQTEQLASSRELAAAAVTNLEVDAERSVLLALQALETADTLEARNALHQSLPELHLLRTFPLTKAARRMSLSVQTVPGLPAWALLAMSPSGRQIQANRCSICKMSCLNLVAASPLVPLVICWLLLERPVWSCGMPTAETNYSRWRDNRWGPRLAITWVSGKSALARMGQRLAVANMDGVSKVWEFSTQTELLALPPFDLPAKAIAYIPMAAYWQPPAMMALSLSGTPTMAQNCTRSR